MRRRPIRPLGRDEVRRLTRRLVFGLGAAGTALVVIFGGLAAYAGMWPPALVVESGSMQHSDTTSELGVLDTGDLVVVQAVRSKADVVTYLEGRASGYTSFGDYGDVIAFADPEPNETGVLIHRAFAFTFRNASGGFDVPQLTALPFSEWWGTATDGTNTTTPFHLRAFTLTKVGWRHDLTITWNLSSLGANYTNDGFLTFGDHNLYRVTKRTDPWILPDAYVIARARGEIPWLGLLRLSLIRSPEGCCISWGSTDPDVGAPGNSWVALEILLVAAVGGPVAGDLAWRYLPRDRLRRGRRLNAAAEDSRAEYATPGGSGQHEVQRAPGRFSGPEDFTKWLEGIDARLDQLRGSLTRERNLQKPT